MAKKQTFQSKLKKSDDTKVIKLVYSYQSEKTGAWRFAEKYVKIPAEGDEQKYLDDALKAGMEAMTS